MHGCGAWYAIMARLSDYAAVPAAQDAPSMRSPHACLWLIRRPARRRLSRGLADKGGYVVAADKGAETCRAAGVVPDAYCRPRFRLGCGWCLASSEAGRRSSSEKYATDLSLAIDCARHEAARQRRPLRLTVTQHLAVGRTMLWRGGTSRRCRQRVSRTGRGTRLRCAWCQCGDQRWRLRALAVGAGVPSRFGRGTGNGGERVRHGGVLTRSPIFNDLGISNMVESEDAVVSVSSVPLPRSAAVGARAWLLPYGAIRNAASPFALTVRKIP